METTMAKNLILYTSSITLSLSYCYFISSKLPKGIYRFISLIPIFYLFTILPLHFSSSSVFMTAITASFTTWLTNFKLIRFAFDLDHSPFHPSYSLLQFITITSLPIKTITNTTSPSYRFRCISLFQIIIFSVLLKLVMMTHQTNLHPNLVILIYCALLFLIIDITVAIINHLLAFLTGLELEPSSNHPYLATSLQDFWGRWNLIVTNTLRHTVYKPVRLFLSEYKWAPLAGVMVTFVVSGLMHELFVYQLSREAPTWEMMEFFVIHGFCVVVEMVLKRLLACRSCWLPEFIGRVLTLGFVVITGMWFFFPPLIRNGIDVKIIREYTESIHFIKQVFYHLINIL